MSDTPNTEQLHHEIEQTRAELGETVAALTEKADVKGRMRDAVEEKKEAAKENFHEIAGAARDIKDHLLHKD